MKVILLKDNKKLGKKGNIINVADGFAFNNLIPNNIAKPATKATIDAAKREEERQRAQQEKQKEALRAQAAQLDKKKISITQHAKEGKLFGSVTQKDIAKAIAQQCDITIDEKNIVLDAPIKELTTRTVQIDYGDNIKANVILTVKAE